MTFPVGGLPRRPQSPVPFVFELARQLSLLLLLTDLAIGMLLAVHAFVALFLVGAVVRGYLTARRELHDAYREVAEGWRVPNPDRWEWTWLALTYAGDVVAAIVVLTRS